MLQHAQDFGRLFGRQHVERAGSCYWGPGLGDLGEGRIQAYRVLLEGEAQARV